MFDSSSHNQMMEQHARRRKEKKKKKDIPTMLFCWRRWSRTKLSHAALPRKEKSSLLAVSKNARA